MVKSVGFILMLDVSGSMSDAIPQVQINANAFLGQGIPGDQFAVNAFSNHAFWVYPQNAASNIVNVSLPQLEAAKKEIDKLKALGVTNITNAIQLGNNMIAKAATDIKAFVLLSDGFHNEGPLAPDLVLGYEPPLYIAGMGYCKEANFTRMLAKNPRSRFFYKPRSYEMMLMFNQIRADSANGALAANKLHTTRGNYYTLDEFYIASSSNAQVCVTWTDKSFIYTPGTPRGHEIYVALIDPDGKRLSVRPSIAGGGFCIFHLTGAKAGRWRVMTEFSTPDTFNTTVGVVDREFCVSTVLDAPMIAKVGEPVNVNVAVNDDYGPCENITMDVHTTKYEITGKPDVLGTEESVPETEGVQNVDINQKETRRLLSVVDGTHMITLDDTAQPGIYNVEVTVEGREKKTGEKFTQIKTVSIILK